MGWPVKKSLVLVYTSFQWPLESYFSTESLTTLQQEAYMVHHIQERCMADPRISKQGNRAVVPQRWPFSVSDVSTWIPTFVLFLLPSKSPSSLSGWEFSTLGGNDGQICFWLTHTGIPVSKAEAHHALKRWGALIRTLKIRMPSTSHMPVWL